MGGVADPDPRLPGGGGNQVCGLYDINPGAFGRIDNLVTRASNFGSDTEVFDGVDISVNARFGGGQLIQGGISTGRTVTNACYLSDRPNLSSGYVATNAQIAPSLGRNLAACPPAGACNATVTISNLIRPNTMLEDRLNQVDLRFSKIFRVGRARVQGNLDIYNALNGSAILTLNTRYGPTWLQPTAILGGRLFEFSAQLDF